MSAEIGKYRKLIARLEIAEKNKKLYEDTQARRLHQRKRKGLVIEDKNLIRWSSRYQIVKAEYDKMQTKLAYAIYEVAENFAKRYKPLQDSNLDTADLCQTAVMYVLPRIHRFDPERKTSCFSFLTACVKNAWLPLLRKEREGIVKAYQYADACGITESYYDEEPEEAFSFFDTSTD